MCDRPGMQAQTVPVAPKLVAGLTIDQLRSGYVEAFPTFTGVSTGADTPVKVGNASNQVT